MLQEQQHVFDAVDQVFTVIYVIELLWNMYGHWFWAFFSSAWCLFDLLIVFFSVFEVMYVNFYHVKGGGPGVNLLRLLRIFRVFRVVKKLRSMQRILGAITASMTPVLSALLLCFVLVSVYAILSVNLFSHSYPHASEFFGTYSVAFISLLGIATGDSWTFEVREMTQGENLDAPVAAFFISYIVMVGIILVNVVVSVLIESFMKSISGEQES